jgi:hypothetical protein
MSDIDVAPAVETPAPPPPPAPDYAAEIKEIHSMLRQSNEPHIPALEDADSGRQKPVYSGANDSGRYLARRRREVAQADPSSAPPALNPEADLVIGYQDDRSEVSAKDAARGGERASGARRAVS